MYVKFYAELQVEQVTSLEQKDEPAQQKVEVAVYYEALCPDSRSFVLKQLLPAYKKIPTQLEVQLIPYGKAKVR